MLCNGFTIPNFDPKKDNFFVMLHFTCTCIKFFTKSIQIIHSLLSILSMGYIIQNFNQTDNFFVLVGCIGV